MTAVSNFGIDRDARSMESGRRRARQRPGPLPGPLRRPYSRMDTTGLDSHRVSAEMTGGVSSLVTWKLTG